MLIKLNKKQWKALDIKVLEEFGVNPDEIRYTSGSVSVELEPYSAKDLKKFQKHITDSKMFGWKAVTADIQLYLDMVEESKGKSTDKLLEIKVRKVEFFATYLKQYFVKQKVHRVYEEDLSQGVMYCSYINNITYVPKEERRGDYVIPEHVHFTLSWIQDNEIKKESFTFYAEDCSHFRTITESFRRKGLYFATEALDKHYEDSIVRFRSMVDNVGEQYLATGSGETNLDDNGYSWWRSHNIVLDKGGEAANVVIDIFKESDEDSSRSRNSRNREEYVDLSYWYRTSLQLNGLEETEQESESEELPIHPTVIIFALKKQARLRVHVDQLVKYEYDESMGDKLILPDESTKLVRTLLSYDGEFQDIVKNKGGGAIVLCTGIAGTGKTLTAEVYAEVMHRPLYTIQCSQLGIDPEELEKQLLIIFSRSERWNAILLLDEADVYIRERGNDLQQNAIVGVFLRVLEYYRGVMFMTTNREKDIDDAIASRCIARVNYSIPESEEKMADIWRVQAEVQGFVASEAVIKKLASTYGKLTGRDIKNLMKLAKLIDGNDKPLSFKTIEFARQFKPTRGIYD